MIYPSCWCFPKYSGNNEQGIKSSQNLAEWCNMFKYVNCVSGSLNDLKEAYKKKLNVTLACHAARVLLGILVCWGWSPVPTGHPWRVYSAPLSISQKVTLRQRPCQLMALQSLLSTAWLSGWFMLLNGSLVLVRALDAEVIYLCTQPSCTQQCSVWPRMRKHPRLPVWDPALWSVLVTFWHGHGPGGAGQMSLTLLPSTRASRAKLGGHLLVFPRDRWLVQPQAIAMLPAAKAPCSMTAEMMEFSM